MTSTFFVRFGLPRPAIAPAALVGCPVGTTAPRNGFWCAERTPLQDAPCEGSVGCPLWRHIACQGFESVLSLLLSERRPACGLARISHSA